MWLREELKAEDHQKRVSHKRDIGIFMLSLIMIHTHHIRYTGQGKRSQMKRK
jgi:hypothetical protein